MKPRPKVSVIAALSDLAASVTGVSGGPGTAGANGAPGADGTSAGLAGDACGAGTPVDDAPAAVAGTLVVMSGDVQISGGAASPDRRRGTVGVEAHGPHLRLSQLLPAQDRHARRLAGSTQSATPNSPQ